MLFARLWILFFLVYTASFSAENLTAREIVNQATHLDFGRSVQSLVRIQVTEKDQKVRERQMLLRRKTFDQSEHTRIDFMAPADIKGLALLVVENSNGKTNQHLYTPALRRVRRIRGSLKSQEFADTDFTYEDMERRNLDDAEYELEGEENIDSNPCYKITATTKKKVRSQYSKTVSWIDKTTFLLRKMELYNRDGKQMKTLKAKKVDQVSGVWTHMALEMKNLEKNRTTLYEVEKIEYDVNLNNNLFTTTALGQ